MRVREITEVFGFPRLGQKTQRQKDADAWRKTVVARKNAEERARDAERQRLATLASLKHGMIKTASDGQEYRCDIKPSRTGDDIIWFNVTTGAEADPAIDAELMK